MELKQRVRSNVASLFLNPDSSSEQVSQLIWGDEVYWLGTDGDFSRVIGVDRYRGWIRTSQICADSGEYELATSTVATLFAEVYREPTVKSEIVTRLTVGSRLVLSKSPTIDKFVPILSPENDVYYMHQVQVSAFYEMPSFMMEHQGGPFLVYEAGVIQQRAYEIAKASRFFVGIPYLWGGTTPFGLDCSGFTQLVYRINGIQLLRDSSEQWADKRFEPVDTIAGLASTDFYPADLLFFGRKIRGEQQITHVGLALGDGKFIHSVGKGRGNIITSCSDPEFTSTFVGARRLDYHKKLSIAYA